MIKHNRTSFPSLWDEIFDLRPFAVNNGGHSLSTPAVNIQENEKEYMIELAAPGLNKKDIKIELDKDTLTIKAEQSEKTEVNEDNYSRREFNYSRREFNYSRREFNYSSFSRSFTMPQGKIDQDKIDAKYEDGVLKLNLPKAEKARLSKEIKVS